MNNVIDHLLSRSFNVLRITEEDIIEIKEVGLNNDGFRFDFCVNDVNVAYEKIESVWFRQISDVKVVQYENVENSIINQFLKNEIRSLKDFFIYALEKKRCLGRLKLQNANKMITLWNAKSVGLSIPDTYITSDRRGAVYSCPTGRVSKKRREYSSLG